jgi:hypothetical protein
MLKAESKRAKGKSKRSPRRSEIEQRHDGWDRFEKAVDAALHHKPISRAKTTKPAR